MCNNPTVHTLTVGATIAQPFPPTLANDQGFTSITEPADQNTTTFVLPGEVMTWKPSGDITSIDNIIETGGENVFSVNPTKQKDGSWSGTIGAFSGEEETYSIIYTVNGTSYTQDPRIRVRAKQ